MISPTCSQLYTRNQMNAGWQLNLVRLNNNTLYFPRPWLPLCLVKFDTPSTSPGYSNTLFSPIPPAAANTYSELLINLYLDLAYATTHEYDNSFVINYVKPGPDGLQKTDYRGYFSKFLNAEGLNVPEQNYNSMIQPGAIIKRFMFENAAVASDVWSDRFRSLINFFKGTIDQNLMGAPGLYEYRTAGSFASPSWTSQTNYVLTDNA
jgi:hypothetical protein